MSDLSFQPNAGAEGTAVDPVCGMTVDVAEARSRDLVGYFETTTYYFCGKGCKLDFEEDPGRYLDPSYVPSM
jgi:YHS domain-containing protein